VHGCRQWLFVVRDTVTHEIQSVTPARERSVAPGPGEAATA
jgi:sarcosine oxidase delta subunit